MAYRTYESLNDALLHLDLQIKKFLMHLYICLGWCLKFSCRQAEFEICLLKFKQLNLHNIKDRLLLFLESSSFGIFYFGFNLG